MQIVCVRCLKGLTNMYAMYAELQKCNVLPLWTRQVMASLSVSMFGNNICGRYIYFRWIDDDDDDIKVANVLWTYLRARQHNIMGAQQHIFVLCSKQKNCFYRIITQSRSYMLSECKGGGRSGWRRTYVGRGIESVWRMSAESEEVKSRRSQYARLSYWPSEYHKFDHHASRDADSMYG